MPDVFVFGAGASMEYRGNFLSPPGWRPLFCDDGFFAVMEDLNEHWGIRDGVDRRPEHYDGGPWDWPTLKSRIEAACGPIGALGLERAFSVVSAETRQDQDLFCRAIELALFWRIRGTNPEQLPVHIAFFNRLLRPGATIITFNYDPLLEFALEMIAGYGG